MNLFVDNFKDGFDQVIFVVCSISILIAVLLVLDIVPATEPRVNSRTRMGSSKNISFDELAERRKSTRQRTEMFGTLNETGIQESHLKKMKEELEQVCNGCF